MISKRILAKLCIRLVRPFYKVTCSIFNCYYLLSWILIWNGARFNQNFIKSFNGSCETVVLQAQCSIYEIPLGNYLYIKSLTPFVSSIPSNQFKKTSCITVQINFSSANILNCKNEETLASIR